MDELVAQVQEWAARGLISEATSARWIEDMRSTFHHLGWT